MTLYATTRKLNQLKEFAMKFEITSLVRFILVSFLLAGSVLEISAQTRHFQSRKEFRPFIRNLPSVDKIELLKFKVYGKPQDTIIEAEKILTGQDANNLAFIWRNQIFQPFISACHNPVHGVKFYSKGKLMVYASICWECNTIALETPYINDTQSFDGSAKQGQQLLQIFQAAFPESK